MGTSGSLPTGPSEQYLRLLKGEISPQEYAKSVRERVDDQGRAEKTAATGSASQATRARP